MEHLRVRTKVDLNNQCLCFVGGWCTKKTNQAKVNWDTSCVFSWELKLIRPCFLWSFHSQMMHPAPATLELLCFTHMFELKPAALYWSDKWLQCEQIASSTHLLQGLQFMLFHKTKDVNHTFLAYAILHCFNSSWRQFDTSFHLPSLLWMSYLDVHCTWIILVSEADFIIRMTIMEKLFNYIVFISSSGLFAFLLHAHCKKINTKIILVIPYFFQLKYLRILKTRSV